MADLDSAHKHCGNHRQEVEASRVCGCFHCLATFPPSEIEPNDWIDVNEDTALCPRCGIDSVIGDASGLPIEDPEFLQSMHGRWFETTVALEDVFPEEYSLGARLRARFRRR